MTKPMLGDFIITNENFYHTSENLKKKKEGFSGVIVKVNKLNYLVRFAEGLDFTTNVDGLLSSKSGCMLTEDEFDVDND